MFSDFLPSPAAAAAALDNDKDFFTEDSFFSTATLLYDFLWWRNTLKLANCVAVENQNYPGHRTDFSKY